MSSRSLAHPFSGRSDRTLQHGPARPFRKLGKRWIRIDRVPFETIAVDHVLLSEAGVFAVETKFTSVEWSPGSTGYLNALVDARQRARTIKLLLDAAGKPTVTPALVVWGPGAPTIPGGYSTIDGVLVLRGSSEAEWTAYLEGLPCTMDRDAVVQMAEIVRGRARQLTR